MTIIKRLIQNQFLTNLIQNGPVQFSFLDLKEINKHSLYFQKFLLFIKRKWIFRHVIFYRYGHD